MNKFNQLSSVFKNSEEGFSEEAKTEMEEIWDRSAGADPAEAISVSDQEVSGAFDRVKSQIRNDNSSSDGNFMYFKYAAAAVLLLIAAGLAYIFIPVTVEAPRGETQLVELPDQSTVQLNSGSRISYSRLFNWRDREVSVQGEAFFDVQSNGQPFRVTTPNAEIKVMGTKFNVLYWPAENNERTSVFLQEGTISFMSQLSDGDGIMLEPGQQSWVSNTQKSPAAPVPVNGKKALDWQKNNIAFEDQPLSSVFAELQRRFDVNINVHPDVTGEKLTIYLSDIEDVESTIKDICQYKGLTYKRQNGKFLVY